MSAIGLSLYRVWRRRLSGLGLRRFALVNCVNDWVLGRVKSRTATVDGHFMLLDDRDSLDLSLNGVYEPFESALIHRLVQPGDTVLDIGANIGYYTLILARCVGPGGRVFAFEPDPENFALLKRNVECNGYHNVTLVNAALSNQAGTVKLHLCDENRGDHRIYSSGDGRPAIEVLALTTDDYCGGFADRIRLIKMDVQGAEGRVLLGMEKVLARGLQCQVIFEFWPLGLHRAGNDPEMILRSMARQGFELQILDEERKELRRIEPGLVLEQFTVEKGNQTNLLASRCAIRQPQGGNNGPS
jgi:FkbM family methyltransferase